MTPLKRRYVFPGIIAGIIIFIAAISLRSSPELQPNHDKSRLVDVISLTKQPVQPVIKAYGRVAPKHIWQGIAEVGGKITYRHPELETGRLIKAGTLVLTIDPLEYQLKLAQAEANYNSAQAQLVQLNQQEINLQSSIEIERQRLTLVDQEYKRKQSLNKKNLISKSELETQKQALLAQRNLVQDLTSSLSLLPDDKKVTAAQVKVNQALLEDAQRQLNNTRFTLPFDARIAEVNIEQAQAVTNGAVLFEAHQLGAVEIKAELSLFDAETLIHSINELPRDTSALPSIEKVNFDTHITVNMGKTLHQWQAKLTRVADTINPDQATIGFYLEVDQDFNQMNLLAKPPLTKGMFVTSYIKGYPSEHYVIPEKALHGEQVYLMDQDNKLVIKQVEVLFRTDNGVAIKGDIHQNDRVVTNDLIPAINGMGLKLSTANETTTPVTSDLANDEEQAL
ncbi:MULTISPECIES: HlyD family secretion protein [unclassified Shewanella]|uniref:efflux RND transporter periplasmic adaptor subunit n=1 Tax=unclassified Shewanella TaxID=196818 RepID=UPI000C849BED|nr:MULTISPECIES: HlyD family secretion protein [unclassified Shewanella]MDO6640358.1 HlyD family secretion protein [Shewanella sp. 5_MG-2023]MDO6775197.1 HlyD family secretion protein [Shewanella sp. 3_MG-2023]PMG29715.1 acriflavin resistance protein [Shewanella sp. 10N.286.52.C2]PMG52346.1 acriflavin resistance protein [Shewanella sp. 10N.286.52.B9]PMI02058.1 acriflavin resistance protein [Shewanella sp. 10N.286.48.A6]